MVDVETIEDRSESELDDKSEAEGDAQPKEYEGEAVICWTWGGLSAEARIQLELIIIAAMMAEAFSER